MRSFVPVFGSAASLLLLLAFAIPSATVLSGCDSNECQDDRITSFVQVELEGTEGLQATCEIQRQLPCGSDSQTFQPTVPETATLGEVTEAIMRCRIQGDQVGTFRLRLMVRNTAGEFGEFDSVEITDFSQEASVSIP